jgi:uncharacterized membrane protein YuzA (DUF378 family)
MDTVQNEIAYFQKNHFQKVIHILVIAGAINWGLIAYNGTDFVRLLANFVSYPKLDTYIKLAVGLAGIFMLYKLILRSNQKLVDMKYKK